MKLLASNSQWRVAKAGRHSYSHPMRHGECRSSTTRHGEPTYSRDELRQPNPSELTWQKPTGEESSTRHGEHTYSQGELSQRKKYKRPFIHVRGDYQIRSDHIRPYYKRPKRNKGKIRETKKSKEHKD